MDLLPQHRELIAKSAITDAVAEERGYFSAKSKAQLLALGFPRSQQLVPALVIPVHGIDGEVSTYQLRPDMPRVDERGKPRKYETRAGSRVVLDVPVRARDWLRDRTQPLFITEGCRKADAAVSAGLCCVALLGVWNWRDADGLLPDWDSIGLKGREVYVVFDSDVMAKPQVNLALARLKAALERRGAEVLVVYLPGGPGGTKVGLDDFLASANTVDDLLARAVPELRRVDQAMATPTGSRPTRRSIDEVTQLFQSWLYLPDPEPLHIILGSYLATRFDGPPVWLLVVGPSSGGKTELLLPLADMPDARLLSTMTEPSLLSGTALKERAHDASGGVLLGIPDGGTIVMKDFTSTISQNRDTRAAVLAALREVFDGRYSRGLGVDGGRILEWKGKVGFIAGVTASIDRHHEVIATMGERFVMYRLADIDGRQATLTALEQATDFEERKAALGEAVRGLLENITVPRRPPALLPPEADYLASLANLAVCARSPVERSTGGSKEIELVPTPESPPRFAQAMHRLLGGILALGVPQQEAWKAVRHVAFSSMPALRHNALEALHRHGGWIRTSTIARDLRHPSGTTLRTLEDLYVLRLIVQRRSDGHEDETRRVAWEWALEPWVQDTLDAPLPSSPQNPDHGHGSTIQSASDREAPVQTDFGESRSDAKFPGTDEGDPCQKSLAGVATTCPEFGCGRPSVDGRPCFRHR